MRTSENGAETPGATAANERRSPGKGRQSSPTHGGRVLATRASTRTCAWALATVAMVMFGPAGAAVVVDQSNVISKPTHEAGSLSVTPDVTMCGSSCTSLMQSFTPTVDKLDWTAAGLSAFSLFGGDATDISLTARIWSTGPSATLLGASAPVLLPGAQAFPTDLTAMTEFVFDAAVFLTPGAIYRLEIVQLSPDYATGYRARWHYTQDGQDGFAGYSSGTMQINGAASALNDLIFATGLRQTAPPEPPEPPAHNVPEAPTASLVALALAAGAVIRRRRPRRR